MMDLQTTVATFIKGCMFSYILVMSMILYGQSNSEQPYLRSTAWAMWFWELVSLLAFAIECLPGEYADRLKGLTIVLGMMMAPMIINIVYQLVTLHHSRRWLIVYVEMPYVILGVMSFWCPAVLIFRMALVLTVIVSLLALVSVTLSIRRYTQRIPNAYSDTEHRDIRWLYHVIVFLIAWVVIYFVVLKINNLLMIAAYNLLCIVFWFVLGNSVKNQRPVDTDMLQSLYDAKKEGGEESSFDKLTYQQLDAILPQLMERDKLFLDPNLTIKTFADFAHVSIYSLSKYLNVHRGETFFEYVNAYRTQYAEACLKAHPTTSVRHLALRSGFNSADVLRRLFKKKYGMTIKRYVGKGSVMST